MTKRFRFAVTHGVAIKLHRRKASPYQGRWHAAGVTERFGPHRLPKPPLLGEVASSVSEDDGEVLQRFRKVPETDKIPETPANATGTVILIYPTRVCFARVSRHKFVTFCWWGAQTLGGYIGQSLQEMADFG